MQNFSQTPISICIPTYNRTEYLQEALESCLKQDYQNFEVIVHDSTSDDRIRRIVESFHSDKIRYIQNNPPLGVVQKLNDFLEKTKSEWMLILCDDDVLDLEYLKILVPYIKKYPDASLIRSRYKLIDRNSKIIRIDRPNKFLMSPYEFLSRIFMPEDSSFTMNISGILFKKSLLKEFGGFTNFYKGCYTDVLAWAQIGSRGTSISDPRPLCSIRLHGSSISASIDLNLETSIKITLKMQSAYFKLLEQMSQGTHTNEEKAYFREAKKGLNDYTRRHLSISMDQGFLNLLEKNKSDTLHEMRRIFQSMKELNVPFFRSVYAYLILAFMPYPIRIIFLKKLRQYKMRWMVKIKNKPWITKQANRFLKKIIRPDFRVLEFGCGGSTIWFDKRVRTLISVEHDQSWYDQIHPHLRNGEILLYPSEQIGSTDHLENPYDYVCDQYPDNYFSLVMIDGRDRVRCVEKARRIVQPGGYLCVDNMDRPAYQPIFQLLPDWKHISTEQSNCLEARENGIWRTDFWQKPSGVDFLFRDFPWPETKPSVAKDPHSLFLNEGPLSKLLNKKMKLIVELGSWLGASTRFMLNHAPNAIVIAIDHWKGSAEHQVRDYARPRLKTLYETFLVNCWDYRERLIPIKETTVNGLSIVHRYGLKPNLFYLDASHDYESVTKDLETIHQYFPESLIVGDDWMWGDEIGFPVRRAARNFSEKVGLKLYVKGNCWWLKPR